MSGLRNMLMILNARSQDQAGSTGLLEHSSDQSSRARRKNRPRFKYFHDLHLLAARQHAGFFGQDPLSPQASARVNSNKILNTRIDVAVRSGAVAKDQALMDARIPGEILRYGRGADVLDDELFLDDRIQPESRKVG